MNKDNEGFLNLTNGKIYYKAYRTDNNAVPLIMVHGGPGVTHDYLVPTAKALSQKRPVILYDQLGCGKSERKNDSSLWNLDSYAKELGEVRKALLEEAPIHLLGHSWGSMLSAYYMLSNPEGIVSLTLSGPCISSPRWKFDQRKNLLLISSESRASIEKCEADNEFDSPQYQDAMMEFYHKFVCLLDPWPECLLESFRNINSDIYSYMWGASEFTVLGTLKDIDLSTRLKEIKVPTLFTCGRHDEATPETTEYYSKSLPGSSLKIFENAAHSHHLEKPEEYIQAINEFLTNTETTSPRTPQSE